MKEVLKRRRYVSSSDKIHTSIYLLPRHRAHIEFLMKASGQSMTDVICKLIDNSIKQYKPAR